MPFWWDPVYDVVDSSTTPSFDHSSRSSRISPALSDRTAPSLSCVRVSSLAFHLRICVMSPDFVLSTSDHVFLVELSTTWAKKRLPWIVGRKGPATSSE